MTEENAEKRHKTGFRGPSPDVGRATQFKLGNRANPGGRPKKTKLTDAYRDWLEQVEPKTGRTMAELLAAAQIKKALKGDTTAVREIADRTEGKARQPIEAVGKVEVKAILIDRAVRPPKLLKKRDSTG